MYLTFEVPASNMPRLVSVIGVPAPESVNVRLEASNVSEFVDPALPMVRTLVEVALPPRV